MIRITLLLSLITTSCISHVPVENRETGIRGDSLEVKYSQGFCIEQFENYKLLSVSNPWQGAEGVSYSYILSDDLSLLDPALLQAHIPVQTPVERVVTTSTTHIAFLESLAQTGSIVGISGSGLINNPEVLERIEKGEVKDIGYEQSMNLEALVMLRPDMIMMYGIESEITAFIRKITELEIPVIMNGDYLERSPLGKLEWIKFTAAFYDMEEQACEYFDSIETEYDKIKRKVLLSSHKPRVMAGLPWKDVWYVSPGNTVLAEYISNAGGLYIFDSLRSSRAVPMDIESVFKRAGETDIWINAGTARSLDDILYADSRFGYFTPLKKDKVYNYTRRWEEGGGNDYWESGVTNPHLVLRDLVKIFHPGYYADSSLVYYEKLQ